MDIEWAKDADDGGLYIVQARPETVASQRSTSFFETYTLTGSGTLILSGKAVGEKIGTGIVRVINGTEDLHSFQPGELLVTSSTSPDWEPVMKTAGASSLITAGAPATQRLSHANLACPPWWERRRPHARCTMANASQSPARVERSVRSMQARYRSRLHVCPSVQWCWRRPRS